MSYLDKIRKGFLFFGNERPPNEVIKFIFMDKSYLLEDFNIIFRQVLDSRGRPDGPPAGGMMRLTFAGTPDYYINEWIIRNDLPRNGEIRFLSGDIKVTSGANYIILFENALCLKYEKRANTLQGGLFTTVEIFPSIVKMGNEVFHNRRKPDEQHPFFIRSGKE